MQMDSLRSRLSYQPHELAFGTSGRRGLIRDITALELYVNVSAEIEYLLSLPAEQGGIRPGDEFFVARDLRPSSAGICRVICHTLRESGMRPINLGAIPTPALTAFALERQRAGIMVTGSHIPFDRNGYKLNTSRGELLKEHEGPVNARVAAVRERVYALDFASSPFDQDGSLRSEARPLEEDSPAAALAWIERYAGFFGSAALAGKRILVYQHSAVGRDLLVEILRRLGADAVPMGRSESFVPIDTENIDAAELAEIQRLADANGPAFAVVSTDGDSDRPLILAPGPHSSELRFLSGDLVGMVVASFLHADSVVVPISCNDAIDRSALAPALEPKTRIGSPWVIAGMNAALARGKKLVCGWEANGGFLLGSAVERGGNLLSPLATRDSFLPILAVLCAAAERRMPLYRIFAELPPRYGRSGLIRNFPRSEGLTIVRELNPEVSENFHDKMEISQILGKVFTVEKGFGKIAEINYTDGVRVRFDGGDVVHIRPSGNADELRIYTVSDSPARAEELVRLGLAEPDGILRQLGTILC